MRLPPQSGRPLAKAASLTAYTILWSVVAFGCALQLFRLSLPTGQDLKWNRSESLPVGLYMAHDLGGRSPHLGELACFPYAPPEWASARNYLRAGEMLCKEVYADAGSSITHDGVKLIVETKSTKTVLPLNSQDSKGRALPSNAIESGKIPPGKYLMIGTNSAKSYDSRYLGLIDQRRLKFTITPIFTFK